MQILTIMRAVDKQLNRWPHKPEIGDSNSPCAINSKVNLKEEV